jgi:hypothetical protein
MFAKIFCTRTFSGRAKHLAALAVPFVFFIAAPPVLAHQQGRRAPPQRLIMVL